MKTRCLSLPFPLLLLGLLPPATAFAEEGGGGHYVPGAMGTMIDNAPTTPGFAALLMYNHYQGDISGGRPLPIAGSIDLGVSAESDTAVLGLTYLYEPKLLGATVMSALFIPYQSLEVEAELSLPLGGTRKVRDSASDLGDMTLIPFYLSWKVADSWTLASLLNVYAPTGSFTVGQLANTGKNYWTFDPTLGASYFNEKTGLSATLFTGVTLNTENADTHYRSGAGFHLDGSVAQYLPLGKGFLGLGATGFYFDQISGDGGSGARLGGFEGSTAGIGPVISYLLPLPGDRTFAAEVKWEPELHTRRRLEGDFAWVKLALTF